MDRSLDCAGPLNSWVGPGPAGSVFCSIPQLQLLSITRPRLPRSPDPAVHHAPALALQDRAPYLTLRGVPENSPSDVPKLRTIEHNLLVNDHNANWPLDHDDGSAPVCLVCPGAFFQAEPQPLFFRSDFYVDRFNVLIHGGSKNLNGYSKQIYGNLFVRPDIGAGQKHCHCNYSPGTSAPHRFGEYWTNNTCITNPGRGHFWGDSGIYLYGPCDVPAKPAGESASSTVVEQNTFMTPGASSANMSVVCTAPNGSTVTFEWTEWQAAGYDAASAVKPWPTVEEMMRMARARLLMKE